MEQTRLRRAVMAVVARLEVDGTADVEEAVLDGFGGDLAAYVEQMSKAALSRDTRALRRSLRGAQSLAAPVQFALPGMEHASLPAWVESRDGGQVIAMEQAPLDDIDAYVARIEQSAQVRMKVAAGYRATVVAARAAGATGEMTGAELRALCPPADGPGAVES